MAFSSFFACPLSLRRAQACFGAKPALLLMALSDRVGHVFREACPAVNWFAWSRLERNRSRITAIGTFNFKYGFLVRYNHLYLLCAIIEKSKFPIITK